MDRRGTTLVEALTVTCMVGILAAIAVPRLGGVADAAAVRLARRDLLAALDAARGAAMRLGAPVALLDDGQRRRVVPLALPDTAATWDGPAAAAHQVSQAGFGSAITFGPAGLATGASNRTITLTRGSASLQVVISRLGRIR